MVNYRFIRYFLLETASEFSKVVEESQAVVLAGGTLTPVCLSIFLFWYVSLEKKNHIILVVIISGFGFS